MVSLHFAMFGDHWSSASRNMMYLICHVISQNPVIEGSINFMSENSLWYVTIWPSLMAIGVAVVEI